MPRLLAFVAVLVLCAIAPAVAAPVRVLLRTEAGPITLELYPHRAPATVANFLAYVDRGLWKGAAFYRAVSPANDHNAATISVLQGGLDRDDCPLPPVPHESTRASGLSHHRGMISMARGAPGTAGCDFFIVTAESPALDYGGARNPDGQGFAAFGRGFGHERRGRHPRRSAHVRRRRRLYGRAAAREAGEDPRGEARGRAALTRRPRRPAGCR